MNQEQNNLNQNNFNTQGNNGISNNQPLNNQNFNQGISFNQQTINSQSQPIPSFQQPVVEQENTPQPVNTVESNKSNNQNFNNTFSQNMPQNQNVNMYSQSVHSQQANKKINIVLIIGIVLVVVIVVGIVIFANKDKKEPINNDVPNNPEIENNNNNEQQNSNTIGKVEEGTNTTYDENGALLFSIEDVFTITGRGTIVTGKVERGKVKVGDTVQIVGLSDEILTTEVIGVEIFRQTLEEATVGSNAGIVLKDITREQVQRGQVLAKTNSIVAATKFDADVYILTKEEGGRHTPFFNDYKPQFYFRTADITGTITLPEGVEMVMPGDNVSFTTTLISPVAMEIGTEFSIREGGRTIANGVVTKVY